MQPAFSVVLLTTLIGAGQGLFIALFLAECYSVLAVLPGQSSVFYSWGAAAALALLVTGLLASFFHLGRPERAWRAAAMWRTSWLSREVIVLPAMMLIVFLYAAVHEWTANPVLFEFASGIGIRLSLILGLIGTIVALLLFVCTGMIYASIRFLQEWATPLTVINFILLGLLSGFVLAATWATYQQQPELSYFFTLWSLGFLLLALMGRTAALWRNARLQPRSTLQTAIGVRHRHIQQTSQGFMGSSFNTREFFHNASAAGIRNIRRLFLLLVFALPALLLIASLLINAPLLLPLAAICQMLGLFIERWYFFSEARHPQNLYYQSVG